jgi:hypothetical protein
MRLQHATILVLVVLTSCGSNHPETAPAPEVPTSCRVDVPPEKSSNSLDVELDAKIASALTKLSNLPLSPEVRAKWKNEVILNTQKLSDAGMACRMILDTMQCMAARHDDVSTEIAKGLSTFVSAPNSPCATGRPVKEDVETVKPATPQEANFTLQRVRDFHYSGGDVDCPHCKDMFTARLTPPLAGAVIISMTVTARRPTKNNHWYRCGVETQCGRPEFSDPDDPRLTCIGRTACNVNRVTDDGVPAYEDDIRMVYK